MKVFIYRLLSQTTSKDYKTTFLSCPSQSCSPNWPLLILHLISLLWLSLSLFCVYIGFISFLCSDGLPAVMQEFLRLACLLASPPFSSLYISQCIQTPRCDVLQSTIQSHPSLALCLPAISLFIVPRLVFPTAKSGTSNAKFRSGRLDTFKHIQ